MPTKPNPNFQKTIDKLKASLPTKSDIEIHKNQRNFRHVKCGAIGELPNELAVTILHSPHEISQIYCYHCKRYFSSSEFVWINTNLSLDNGELE